jgi:hypothetical protein
LTVCIMLRPLEIRMWTDDAKLDFSIQHSTHFF